MSTRREDNSYSPLDDDDLRVVFRRPSWQLRACLISVLITPLLYRLYLILATIGHIICSTGDCGTSFEVSKSNSAMVYPEVDLSWTGVFPCELGWKGRTLAVVILSAVFLASYSMITACLLRWNPRKQLRQIKICSPPVLEPSLTDRPTKLQVRVQSTNRLSLAPTLNVCLLLLAFHLLLQSGDIESNPGPTMTELLTLEDLHLVLSLLVRVTDKWCNLGLALGVHISKLTSIKNEHPSDNDTCMQKMLTCRLTKGPLTLTEVCSCLHQPTVDRNDVVGEIEKQCSEPDVSGPPTKRPTTALDVYKTYLTNIYNTKQLPADAKRPLGPVKHFINLECASIREFKSRINVEENWKNVARGGLSFFGGTKIHVDQIACKLNGAFPKLVIIKGAPGVGKTTLCWELCRRWAMGELWTSYSLVVLLQLRDGNNHNILKVEDFLQHRDRSISECVCNKLIWMNGVGVIFILEGLDELPKSVREDHDSLVMQLITGRLLPGSTVLVTTRPWAVCDLPSVCSSRLDQFIEILGFSPDQIKQYIDNMIEDGAPASLRKYIDSNPHISSAMYNPLHARIVVEVYTECYSQDKCVFPNTTTELYTAYAQVSLTRFSKCNPVNSEQEWNGELDDLPASLKPHFDRLCLVAYKGITSEKQQLVFFKKDIPDDSLTFGFMNSVHPLHQSITKKASPSYNFLHLTLQEFLAAFHIWKSHTPQEQLVFFVTKAKDGAYKMVLLFLAGLTKFRDPWTQCALPVPYISKAGEKESNLLADHILWLYESQNKDTVSLYEGTRHSDLEMCDNNLILIALGYCMASTTIAVDIINGHEQLEMILEGIKKGEDGCSMILNHLTVADYWDLSSLPIDEILQLKSLTVHVFPTVPMPPVKPLSDLIQHSPNLNLCEVNLFDEDKSATCSEFFQPLLDALKNKSCLKTLKWPLKSSTDSALLTDFIAISSISVLEIEIEFNISYWKSRSKVYAYFHLNTDEMRKHKQSFTVNDAYSPDYHFVLARAPLSRRAVFFPRSAFSTVVECLSDWKPYLSFFRFNLSLSSQTFYLSHSESKKLFELISTCPMLSGLETSIISHVQKPKGHLENDSLLTKGELYSTLAKSQTLRSVVLTIDNKDERLIGNYLQANTILQEMQLKLFNSMQKWPHSLMEGLKINCNLISLILSGCYIGMHSAGAASLASVLQYNKTLQHLELPLAPQDSNVLLPGLKALFENTSLFSLKLFVHKAYPLSTEEAEAANEVLATNSTLEVFHIIAEITDCSPIIKGLLANKTLKEFGTAKETEKYIVSLPDYIKVRKRMVFFEGWRYMDQMHKT